MTALSRASFCLFISSRICSAISFRFFTIIPRILYRAEKLVSKARRTLRNANFTKIAFIAIDVFLQRVQEKLGVHRSHDDTLLHFGTRVMRQHLYEIEENLVLVVANHHRIGISAAWVTWHFQLDFTLLWRLHFLSFLYYRLQRFHYS